MNSDYDQGMDWSDGTLGEILGEVMSDEYADLAPEELDEAISEVLESLSPAEAFGFTKALRQIGSSAGRIISDPAFAQVTARVLPAAGGALGTVIGGPVGTALGTQLGTVASRSLPQARKPAASAAATPAATPGAAGGSAAAAQGLVLTQHPDVLKGLLALALGEQGKRSVDGVPVAALMSMLSSVFGKAAADADELMYLGGYRDAEDTDEWAGDDESLYMALVDADNAELAETVRWP